MGADGRDPRGRVGKVCLFTSLFCERLTSRAGRSIGVSNFTLELLQRVVKMGRTVPAVNQVRRVASHRF